MGILWFLGNGKSKSCYYVMLLLCSSFQCTRRNALVSIMNTIWGIFFFFDNLRQSIQTIAARSWYPTPFRTSFYNQQSLLKTTCGPPKGMREPHGRSRETSADERSLPVLCGRLGAICGIVVGDLWAFCQ